MTGRYRQVVVYGRVTILCLLAAAVVVLVVKNWDFKTRFWPGASDRDVPTLWLMAATAAIAIVVFWIFCKMRRVFADLSDLRVERARERQIAEHEHRAKTLDEQERRIDAKIQKALEPEKPKPSEESPDNAE